MKVIITLTLLLLTGHCHAIENKDLYDIVAQGSVTVPRGDENFLLVNLQSPIHFYTEKYDSIYVSFPIKQPIRIPPKNIVRLHIKEKRDIFRQVKMRGGSWGERQKEYLSIICIHIIPSCLLSAARHHLKIFHHGSSLHLDFIHISDDKNRYQYLMKSVVVATVG